MVHELAHLVERSHNSRFVGVMDRHLPDWPTRRDELNGAPLAAEEWSE
nr:M48 family metallopeptidase [Corynebacterium aurimucosum]